MLSESIVDEAASAEGIAGKAVGRGAEAAAAAAVVDANGVEWATGRKLSDKVRD